MSMAPSPPCSDAEESIAASARTVSPNSNDPAPLLGDQAQTLIACNQKLQELGIDNTIKLPRIVVIGDQSTGKSSLIEAISTIKVPKAKGCCTQCPIAINLISGSNESSPWTCAVSIEEHYDWNADLRNRSITKNNPLGPWQKKDQMKVVPVKTTNIKDEVSDIILAAQAAVLNPGADVQEYLGARSFDKSKGSTTKFSPNVIRLDISEGNWANLSFIDLPGVIANMAKEHEKYLVNLIRNLVQQYASAERSVNMLTLPMTHDVENSQACAIIQDLKVQQKTLAVFTKADLVDEDQCKQFMRRFVADDDLGFTHGYHFVVMPDNMDLVKARVAEAKVFAKEPWCLIDRDHQERLGVNALRIRLRELLFQKTSETLPENLASIKARLNEVESELMALPEPPNAALLPLQLQQSVTRFDNEMRSLFSGSAGGGRGSAKSSWNEKMKIFQDKIASARPTLNLMDDDEKSRLSKARAKSKRQQSNIGTIADAIEVTSGEELECPTSVKKEKQPSSKFDPVHRFKLKAIQKLNADHYQACVPGEIEHRAVEEMNKLSVKHWHELLSNFMDECRDLLNTQIDEVIIEVFGSYRHLELFSIIHQQVKAYIAGVIHQEWLHADELCQLEQEKPFTYNSIGLKKHETTCSEERFDKRLERRKEIAEYEGEGGQRGPRQRKKDIDPGPDPYHTEVLMSAKNKAYYEIASIRFVDNICMGINGRLLPACTDKLIQDLEKHLGLKDSNKHEQIVTWMSEHPEREAQRRRLLREQTRLAEGLQYIQDILGANNSSKSSPSKRLQSNSPQVSDSDQPKTPSKRAKTIRPSRGRAPQVSPTRGDLATRTKREETEDETMGDD